MIENAVGQGIGPAADPVVATTSRAALEVELGIYGIEAIRRAAYKFTGRAHVFLATSGTGKCVIVVSPKQPGADPSEIARDLGNELLDQQVRESLAQEFGQIRTLLVAQAFSEGNLLDPDRDDGDYSADPRGAGRRR